MNHSAAPSVDVDLNRVSREVLKEASVIALVRRGVVECRVGKRQNGRHLSSRRGELEEERGGEKEHVTFLEG
jgi:hypothetical protein